MKISDRYSELMAARSPYVNRARNYAALTVPSVLPPAGQTGGSDLPQTYQSTGTRLATSLAAKVLLAFLPPGSSDTFKFGVPPKVLLKGGTLSVPQDIALQLAMCEKLAGAKIETIGWRRQTFRSLLNLIVTGNVLEYMLPDGRLKLYRLDQYVVVRDWAGVQIEVIAHDRLDRRALPEDIRAKVKALPVQAADDAPCEMYSRFTRVSDKSWRFEREVDGHIIETETYNTLMPVKALRWVEVEGEAYGRSHVEDNYADLSALDQQSQNLVEGGVLAARHLIFVKPNAAGGNLRKKIAEAKNGDVISANPEDVEAFQFNNAAAMQVIAGDIERLVRQLSAAFMMTTGLQRNAERVTAFELRQLAQELESALGGVYTLLAGEMQAWRLRKLIEIMGREGELPPFKDDEIDLTVTTGLEALGRDETLNKVNMALDLVAKAGQVAPELATDTVKASEILAPGLAALGFPNAVRSNKEVEERQAQRQAQQQQDALMQAAAGPVATALTQPQQ